MGVRSRGERMWRDRGNHVRGPGASTCDEHGAARGWTAVTLVLLAALTGAVAFLSWRVYEMSEQTAALATKVADVEQDLDSEASRVGELQGSLDQAKEDVASVGKKVEAQALRRSARRKSPKRPCPRS